MQTEYSLKNVLNVQCLYVRHMVNMFHVYRSNYITWKLHYSNLIFRYQTIIMKQIKLYRYMIDFIKYIILG